MKKLIFFFIVLPLISFSQLQNYEKYIPASSSGDIYHYDFYSVSLLEDHKLPEWTIYFSTKERIEGNGFSRKGLHFKKDPKVPTLVENIHFYRNVYDKGHLVPAADMSFDYDALKQSFYFANLTPQHEAFNRGVWKQAEKLARDWTRQYDSLIIISGCVFKDEDYILLPTGLAIPELYYKVVIDIERMSAIGLVFPNSEVENSLISYVYSIDDIEKLIGVDFLCNLPERDQKLIEKEVHFEDWSIENSETSFYVKPQKIQETSKMAFAIGNNDYYRNSDKLENAKNDANLIYNTFVEMKFDTVILLQDQNYEEMKNAVRRFQDLSYNYDLNIFYYAGHGIQDPNGNSYLVPINYNGDSLENIAISVHELIYYLSKDEKNKSIVILDACREDYNNRSMSKPNIEDPVNLKLGFSTSFGKKAFDHPELDNSLYTSTLSRNLLMENMTLSTTFHATWNKVFNATHHKQSPSVYFGQQLENLILLPK